MYTVLILLILSTLSFLTSHPVLGIILGLAGVCYLVSLIIMKLTKGPYEYTYSDYPNE